MSFNSSATLAQEMHTFDIMADDSSGVENWLRVNVGKQYEEWWATSYNRLGGFELTYDPDRNTPLYINRYTVFGNEIAIMFKLMFSEVIHTTPRKS